MSILHVQFDPEVSPELVDEVVDAVVDPKQIPTETIEDGDQKITRPKFTKQEWFDKVIERIVVERVRSSRLNKNRPSEDDIRKSVEADFGIKL